MKLSIVIICWNDVECLGPCLESIYASKLPFEFEVIVSDNRSTDGSAELVRTKFPQTRLLVNPENLGFGPGNNAGVDLATGDYLLILNPDTLIHRGALRKLIAFLDAHPEAGAVGPRVLNTDGSFQLSAHPLPSFANFLVKALFLRGLGHIIPGFPADEYMGWKGEKTRTVGFCAACALLMRTDLFRELGGFDASFKHQYEDTDLCARVKKEGYDVYYYPEAEITHIRGANRGRYPIDVLKKAEFSKYRYFAKHFGHPGLLRLISILHCSLRAAGLFLLGKKERAATFASLLAWHWHREMDGYGNC
jgi:GT2 family glycosyltransferase